MNKYRTVEELIEKLKTLPQNYEVFYDYIYSDIFDCITVNDKDKEVYIS